MEPLGAVSEANWNSFNATMPVDESEIMALLLGPYPFTSSDHELGPSVGIPTMLWLDPDSDSYHFPDNSDPSSNFWSQLYSSTSTDSFFPPTSEYETYCRSDLSAMPAISASCAPMDVWVAEEQITNPSVQILPTHQFADPVFLNEEVSSDDPIAFPDREALPESKIHTGEEDEPFTHDEIPTGGRKKKARASAKVERSAKIARSKKTRRDRDESESNAAVNGQSSSSCSSEDDSIAPHEGGGMRSSSKGCAALDQKGSRRAGRGSATDPQSLYARKRREKISERLRILQNLVPNGTKVDISTMLEEAVQYVKFLEVQIKLLSSDELWMYAPIAYNGMGIGIDLMVSPPRQ